MPPEMRKLLESFLSLGSSGNVNKVELLKRDFEEYLRHNEDTDDKKMENTVHLLRALVCYAETGNVESAYKLASPMLENFEFGELGVKIEYLKANYNKELLIYSILVCQNYKQALSIIDSLEKSFDLYNLDENLQERARLFMYINFVDRLLYADTFEDLSKYNMRREVSSLFRQYILKARHVCVRLEMRNWEAVLDIKEGLFFEEINLLIKGLRLARTTKEVNLYEALDSQIMLYAEKKVFQSVNPTPYEIVRETIRNKLVEKGMSLSELSLATGVSIHILREFSLRIRESITKTDIERITIALDINWARLSIDVDDFKKGGVYIGEE